MAFGGKADAMAESSLLSQLPFPAIAGFQWIQCIQGRSAFIFYHSFF